jgi:hypothetical protein
MALPTFQRPGGALKPVLFAVHNLVKSGAKMYRLEQNRLIDHFKVERTVMQSFGDKNKGGLGNDMSFFFRSHTQLDFRIEATPDIGHLSAKNSKVLVDKVVMAFFFHKISFRDHLPPHVDAGSGYLPRSSEVR